MSLLDEIAIALANEANRRGIDHFPVGPLVVNVRDWETKAADITFDLWPCPANPTASWGAARAGAAPMLTPTLWHIDVNTAREHPTEWPGAYLEPYIHSGFVDVMPEHGSGGRFWAESKDGLRAPGLYLPAPGMAKIWPRLAGVPNVLVELAYSNGAHVLLASRFEPRCDRHPSHNLHLFDLPVPQAWGEGKQFGDARVARRRSRPMARPKQDD